MPRRPVVPVSRGEGGVTRSNLPEEPGVPRSPPSESEALAGGTLDARAGLVNLQLLDRLNRLESAVGAGLKIPRLALDIVDRELSGLQTLITGRADQLGNLLRKNRNATVEVAQVVNFLGILNGRIQDARQTVAEAFEQAAQAQAEE